MKHSLFAAKRNRSGFTLLGTLIAAFIATITITALTALISQVYSSGRLSKNRFIATNLAKEGLELVHNIRDNNWLHYPEAPSEFAFDMKWRGETSDVLPCASGNCLKSICDGNSYVVDAKDADVRLKTGANKLYLDSNNMYTHQSSGNASTIFSRKIDITTESAGSGWVKSACGASVISNTNNPDKPTPFTATVTVSWTEPGTGAAKSVVLNEMFYDWLRQRP